MTAPARGAHGPRPPSPPQRGRVRLRAAALAIADGMGGAQAGELASRLAAATVGRAETTERSGRERVVALIEAANRSVERASVTSRFPGWGRP